MGKIDNIKAFQDTKTLCYNNPLLKNAIKNTCRNQFVVYEKDNKRVKLKTYPKPASIQIVKGSSLNAAAGYTGKTCVLNFASSSYPGGSVHKGAGGQEESLSRCSTLYFCISDKSMMEKFYLPHRRNRNILHTDDCIYSPDIIVMKKDFSHVVPLPEEEWFKVNVISCAPPRINSDFKNDDHLAIVEGQRRISEKAFRNLLFNRYCRILELAASQGNETLVLGLFGCGAYNNPPQIVAEEMKRAIEKYAYCFKTIVIPTGTHKMPYYLFKRVFEGE